MVSAQSDAAGSAMSTPDSNPTPVPAGPPSSPTPNTGVSPAAIWIIVIVVALIATFVTCALVTRDTKQCHYDAATGLSVIIEGKMDASGNIQSSSRYVPGNVCD